MLFRSRLVVLWLGRGVAVGFGSDLRELELGWPPWLAACQHGVCARASLCSVGQFVRRIWVRLWVFDERALVVGGGWGSEFILVPSWREWLLARG